MKSSDKPGLTLKSLSPGQTEKIGRTLGQSIRQGLVIALDGDLGSGKTVFVRGLAKGLKVTHPKEVRSPTFALIQEHPGRIPLCHVDLYRLEEPEIRQLGLEEYWKVSRGSSPRAPEWVVALEWAERAGSFIPQGAGTLRIRFRTEGKAVRILDFWGDKEWKEKLERLKF